MSLQSLANHNQVLRKTMIRQDRNDYFSYFALQGQGGEHLKPQIYGSTLCVLFWLIFASFMENIYAKYHYKNFLLQFKIILYSL